MREVHGLRFGLWIVLGIGCGSDSDPKQEQDAMVMEPSTTADASADDNDTEPPKGGEPVGSDNPATPGNDAANAVACGADVSDCGDKVCCSVGFGVSACENACAGGQQPTICDGPEDCGKGTICCSGIGSNTCQPAEQCTGRFSCHNDTHCPAGLKCEPGDSFTWWGFCR